jgi:hypothetical protein
VLESSYRLIRDAVMIFVDGIDWLWRTLWKLNRGIIRAMLPGQSKVVHSTVTVLAVLLEIIGLVVLLADWGARH